MEATAEAVTAAVVREGEAKGAEGWAEVRAAEAREAAASAAGSRCSTHRTYLLDSKFPAELRRWTTRAVARKWQFSGRFVACIRFHRRRRRWYSSTERAARAAPRRAPRRAACLATSL